MTIAQTAYNKFFQGAAIGGLFDISEFLDIITATDITDGAGTLVAVPFGVGVCVDTAAFPHRFTSEPETDKLCRLPSGAGDIAFPNFLGVAMRRQMIENDLAFANTKNAYPPNYPVGIVHKGRVWVSPEQTVVVTDPVYVRYAAGAGGTQLGSFRKDADTASAAQAANARWYRGSDVNGLAVLELNV